LAANPAKANNGRIVAMAIRTGILMLLMRSIDNLRYLHSPEMLEQAAVQSL
jgi:hypothetical protein